MFSASAAEATALISPRLTTVITRVEDRREFHPFDSVASVVIKDYELLKDLLEWGATSHRGSSIINVFNIEDVYGPEDLDRYEVLELFTSDSMEPREIENLKTAFECVWECEYCHRLQCRQIASLRVKIGSPKRAELQETWDGDLLVHPRLISLFGEAGSCCRSLDNSKGFVQVIPNPECRMNQHRFPIRMFKPCPGCGRRHVRRETHVTQFLPSQLAAVQVRHNAPALTLDSSLPEGCCIGSSDIAMNGGVVDGFAPYPVHVRGQARKLDFGERSLYGRPVYFARSEFVRKLYEVNAKGFEFRPAYVGEPPPDAFSIPKLFS